MPTTRSKVRRGEAPGPARSASPVVRSMVSAVVLALTLGACGRGDDPNGATVRPRFDGEAAYGLVRRQVAFGPRIPGSEGHARQLSWMLARLDSLAPVVVADTFAHVTSGGDSLTLVNVSARFAPSLSRRVLLLAHWDTRPRADRAADPADRELPVPGANDGASGTAVLLELASLFARQPPPVGVELLLVDGEDYGPGADDMFLGARRYASSLGPDDRPVYGLLLDMVGDADPSFPVEGYSEQYASVVVRKVWRAAEALGHGPYFPRAVGQRLFDDHLPLIEAGLPTANVVDFSYGPGNAYWHTPDDRPEHVSASTLGMIGEVVAELIYSGG